MTSRVRYVGRTSIPRAFLPAVLFSAKALLLAWLMATTHPRSQPGAPAPAALVALRRILQPVASDRRFLSIIATVVAVNIVLLAAYLWSRGGEELHVRVQVRGDEFSAWVDGRLQARARLVAPQGGGVGFVELDTAAVPSLPEPRGLRSFRVTDPSTGRVLFEDRFEHGADPAWEAFGQPVVSAGTVGMRDTGGMQLPDRGWRDYVVDAVFRNPTGGAIIVRRSDDQNGVVYRFTPLRDVDNELDVVTNDTIATRVPAGHLRPDLQQSVRAMLAMALRPYPLVLAGLATAFVLALALQAVRIRGPRRRLPDLPAAWPWVPVGALAVAVFGITLYFNYGFGSHMPHVPDEVSYLFQAKLLASGRLHASPPPVADAFDFFRPPLIQVAHGHWASIYPFGHPLVLAIGELVGAPWLIPPLLGAASIVLLFALGRRLYDTRTALVAAVLMASSPFFLMTASNYMSHNTAAFYLLASLVCLSYADRHPFGFGLGAGLCFGLLFNTRPLSATVLALPVALLLLYRLSIWRRPLAIANIVGFVVGGLVMLEAYFLYNYASTGDPLISGYQTSGTLGQAVGFGGQHTFLAGMENEQSQLAFLLLVLDGWPLFAGIAVLLLPLVLVSRDSRDWFVAGCAVLLMGAPVIFEGRGIMHGPRYWYEAVPLLMLLTARGVELAGERIARAAALVWGGLSREPQPLRRAPALALPYLLVAALIGSAVYGWLLGRHVSWHDDFVPARAVELKGFNGIDDRLTRQVDHAGLHNALVLVRDCQQWQCFGSVFWRNNPSLDGDVVYARDLDSRRADLLRLYDGRRVYIADYDQGTLQPYTGPPALPAGH